MGICTHSATTSKSTGTVHTSAKARLTLLPILIRIPIRIRDPDCHQNLIICSLARCQPSLKISCKSVRSFLRKVANRQTDKDTNRQTNKHRRLHILLGGGNNTHPQQFKKKHERNIIRRWKPARFVENTSDVDCFISYTADKQNGQREIDTDRESLNN